METINLNNFLSNIRGKKYKELISYHIKKTDTLMLLKACTGTVSLLPQELQNMPTWESFIDHMNKYIPLKIHGYTLWDFDCVDAFIFVIKEADTYLSFSKCLQSELIINLLKLPEDLVALRILNYLSNASNHDQELLFNIFQIITLGYSYNASSDWKIRKFIGIKKGFFF